MNFKSKIKMVIDISMSIVLFGLMSFQSTGQKNHEIVGVVMLILFILHNIMNYRWYITLRKGKYSIQRSVLTITDILLFVEDRKSVV